MLLKTAPALPEVLQTAAPSVYQIVTVGRVDGTTGVARLGSDLVSAECWVLPLRNVAASGRELVFAATYGGNLGLGVYWLPNGKITAWACQYLEEKGG